jgi:hypothetical protein
MAVTFSAMGPNDDPVRIAHFPSLGFVLVDAKERACHDEYGELFAFGTRGKAEASMQRLLTIRT